MDPNQFDQFTKALATNTSRRQALKTFAATAFGGILALSGLGTAFAKKKCPPGSTNCHGTCVNTSTDPNNCGNCGTVCASGVCNNGVCTCGTGGCASACPGNPACDCVTTVDMGIVCVHPICTFISCTKSSNCPSGQVCFTQGCCGAGSFCVPTC